MVREISSSSNTVGAGEIAMPAMLLKAAIEGNKGYLVRLLELEEQEDIHTVISKKTVMVVIDPQDPVEYEHLQSVMHFGDNLLHILVTKKHDELAFMVFEKDKSLLKERNKVLETPLHSAAKVGNESFMVELIQRAPDVIKEVLGEKNCRGETALHEAAIHGHEGVVNVLMQFHPKVAHEVTNEGLSPLYIATIGGNCSMVKSMLQNDACLAYIPDSNGLFSVHVAARIGDVELVGYFMQKHHNLAILLDYRGRNLFHIAAEENKKQVFAEVFKLEQNKELSSEMVTGMINARNYEGNTPLHIAAMKGHKSVMEAIWKRSCHISEEPMHPHENIKGQTPFDLSVIQVKDTAEDMPDRIMKYVKNKGRYFTPEWFGDIMEPPYQNIMERTQVIGLGSVLITTITFAVAFTLPGGLNQTTGTPILGRKYIFKAFIMADSVAFLQAFMSLFTLVFTALRGANNNELIFAVSMFLSAASCMVVAFGLGLYVMLAPVSLPIAIFVLFYSLLLGSPFGLFYILFYQIGVKQLFVRLLDMNFGGNIAYLLFSTVWYGIPLLSIFIWAFT